MPFPQIKELRSKGIGLCVNAGNNFGGFWYNQFGSQIVSEFFSTSLLDFDVITFGSSDLDLEAIPQQNVTQFLSDVSVASRVVSCNVGSKYISNFYSIVRRSTTMSYGAGRSIGVIGFVGLTGAEKGRSSQFVTFSDPIKCLQEESESLRRSGVEIIIAIGSGTSDLFKDITLNVSNVDVVIGSYGASKNLSLLTKRTSESYPDYVKEGPNGQTIVATADVFGQSVGMLSLTFDKRGNLISHNGTLVRLDQTMDHGECLSMHISISTSYFKSIE